MSEDAIRRLLRRLEGRSEDPEPPGLDPFVEVDDGWNEPLDPGDDDAAFPSAAGPSPTPRGAPQPERHWAVGATALVEAADVLGRLDALWGAQTTAIQAALEVRVCWREGVYAALSEMGETRQQPLSLWLRQAGLGPSLRLNKRVWEEGLDEDTAVRSAQSLAAALGAALRSGGADYLTPDGAEVLLGRLGTFRQALKDRTDEGEGLEFLPRTGFDREAWERWLSGAMREDLTPLAAWADAMWAWRLTAAVELPRTVEAWLLGTHILRVRKVLRHAPLPLWAGFDRRRQIAAAAARDEAEFAGALLSAVAEAGRDHLRLLADIREKDEKARRWFDGRSRGRLARALWELLLATPAVSAVPAARAVDGTPQAVTRALLEMKEAGLVREVSGREAWRIWSAV